MLRAETKPILFIDFDGTLCHDRYWRSLPLEVNEKVQELLFRNDRSLVVDWMVGTYTAEEVNRYVAEKLELNYEELWNLFILDCQSMRVDIKALELLQELRNTYVPILATGNMDSFTRFTVPALHLDKYFEKIVSSSDVQIQKTEPGGRFFTDIADSNNSGLQDSILIDDQEKVCSLFETLGGKALRVTNEKSLHQHLIELRGTGK